MSYDEPASPAQHAHIARLLRRSEATHVNLTSDIDSEPMDVDTFRACLRDEPDELTREQASHALNSLHRNLPRR